ncbi:hypothetical protein, partial [Bacteroides acidifaciens]
SADRENFFFGGDFLVSPQKVIAYPAAIYCCFVFDDDSKVAKFRSVKDKAFSKRLSLYNTSPTPP